MVYSSYKVNSMRLSKHDVKERKREKCSGVTRSFRNCLYAQSHTNATNNRYSERSRLRVTLFSFGVHLDAHHRTTFYVIHWFGFFRPKKQKEHRPFDAICLPFLQEEKARVDKHWFRISLNELFTLILITFLDCYFPLISLLAAFCSARVFLSFKID